MVAIKAHAAAQFLKSPDARLSAFLFHGTDPGLISERAQLLAKRIAERDNPPGEVLRLDDADLENDPDKLGNELFTVPMFGGRKIVRAITGRRINVLSLKPLVEGGPLAGVLIVEAGSLKKEDALRLAFEKHSHTAAIECYGDEARDLSGLVSEVVGAAQMTISPDAQQTLIARLGADRTLSRGEIEKLALYAHGRSRIEIDDVEAIVGDASELAIDAVVMAAASGDATEAIEQFGRLIDSGESPQTLVSSLQRHFQRLHRVRAALDAGRQFDEVVRTLRPPVYFKHKPVLSTQARLWTISALNAAMTEIASAAKEVRLAGALDEPIAERLMWRLAQKARSLGPARGTAAR
jgi:DNA polymerase-3 subunit delta